VGRGDDLGGDVEAVCMKEVRRALRKLTNSREFGKGQHSLLSEELDALVGESVVVPTPAELGLDVAARVQRLSGLDDEEVLDIELDVLWGVEVLLRDEDSLCEFAMSACETRRHQRGC
jgi:hypothetical protein